MTAILPSLAKLKPNPHWAKLPLFNRKNWSRVRFDDVVENLNETCEPAKAGLERVIAMEHLEPGSLHIRAWGNVADGTTFTRRCRPGQVLFGKRRAYQRKVAVAEFDAVVSGDIYVLAPKGDRLLPERRGLREIGIALSRPCLVAVTQSLTRRNFEAASLTGLA